MGLCESRNCHGERESTLYSARIGVRSAQSRGKSAHLSQGDRTPELRRDHSTDDPSDGFDTFLEIFTIIVLFGGDSV